AWRDLPVQRGGRGIAPGEVDRQAIRHRADELVAELASQGRDPLAGQWPSLHRFTVPAWRRPPGVLLAPVASRGARNGLLIPRVQGGQGRTVRILLEAVAFPALLVGLIHELFYP